MTAVQCPMLFKTEATEMFVPGDPIAQGDLMCIGTRWSRTQGRNVYLLVHKNGGKLKDWRNRIRKYVREEWPHEPTDRAIRLDLVFRFKQPKSREARREHASRTTDLDKLVRAVYDALTGVLYTNDARVVCSWIAKEWGQPGVLIRVEELE